MQSRQRKQSISSNQSHKLIGLKSRKYQDKFRDEDIINDDDDHCPPKMKQRNLEIQNTLLKQNSNDNRPVQTQNTLQRQKS